MSIYGSNDSKVLPGSPVIQVLHCSFNGDVITFLMKTRLLPIVSNRCDNLVNLNKMAEHNCDSNNRIMNKENIITSTPLPKGNPKMMPASRGDSPVLGIFLQPTFSLNDTYCQQDETSFLGCDDVFACSTVHKEFCIVDSHNLTCDGDSVSNTEEADDPCTDEDDAVQNSADDTANRSGVGDVNGSVDDGDDVKALQNLYYAPANDPEIVTTEGDATNNVGDEEEHFVDITKFFLLQLDDTGDSVKITDDGQQERDTHHAEQLKAVINYSKQLVIELETDDDEQLEIETDDAEQLEREDDDEAEHLETVTDNEQLESETDDAEQLETDTDDEEWLEREADNAERVKGETDDDEEIESEANDAEQCQREADDTEEVDTLTDQDAEQDTEIGDAIPRHLTLEDSLDHQLDTSNKLLDSGSYDENKQSDCGEEEFGMVDVSGCLLIHLDDDDEEIRLVVAQAGKRVHCMHVSANNVVSQKGWSHGGGGGGHSV